MALFECPACGNQQVTRSPLAEVWCEKGEDDGHPTYSEHRPTGWRWKVSSGGNPGTGKWAVPMILIDDIEQISEDEYRAKRKSILDGL